MLKLSLIHFIFIFKVTNYFKILNKYNLLKNKIKKIERDTMCKTGNFIIWFLNLHRVN